MKESDIRKREVFNKYLSLVEEDVKKTFNFNAMRTVQCPACGSKGFKQEFKKSGFQHVSCDVCGLLFVNPRPRADDLAKLYTDSRATTYWVNEFYKPMVAARKAQIFKPRADYINKLCKGGEGFVVGDIGASFGLFLEEMKKVWPVARFVAIEPSPEAVKICAQSGFETISSVIEDVSAMDNSFDLLTAFELLDHLLEPGEFLSKVTRLLKPGGYFVATAVNGMGFDTLLLWEKSKMFSPPLHLNLFNPVAAKMALERAGLEIAEISTPGVLDWDIIEGMIKDEKYDMGRLWNFVAYNCGEKTKKDLQDWITKNGLSSHMRLVAKKVK